MFCLLCGIYPTLSPIPGHPGYIGKLTDPQLYCMEVHAKSVEEFKSLFMGRFLVGPGKKP